MPWSSSSRTRSPFRSEGVDLKADQRQLQDSLGHRFADRALLERALTHRSFGPDNNERLEFLGDALIGLIIAEELFNASHVNAKVNSVVCVRAW